MSRDTQLSIEAHGLLTEIENRGYSELRHGIPDEQIDILVDAYTDFTLNHPDPLPETMDGMLPTEPTANDLANPAYRDKEGNFVEELWLAKQLDELDRSQDSQPEWHKYRTNTVGIGKPDGYSNRSFQERALRQARGIIIPSEDPKEFFHHSSTHHVKMAQNHTEFGWGTFPSELAKLELAFSPIHRKASELILRVAGLVEETHPGVREFFSVRSLASSPVRLLFYHPLGQEQLGAGHYDKSAVTVQIGESHEGLRVAPNKEADLEPIVRGSDMAVVFPGKAIKEKFGKDTPYKPGWHDIVRADQLNEGRTVPPRAQEVCARWALIFFANGEGFVAPDKTAMHTR
jgi:hypothetical protein